MPEPGAEITVEEALGWIGFKLDEVGGASAGRVESVLVDAGDGAPTWIVARLGRFGRRVAVPVEFVVAGVGHVWIPFDRDTLRATSGIDPAAGLSCADERSLAERYGVPVETGRLEVIAGRAEDELSSVPAAG